MLNEILQTLLPHLEFPSHRYNDILNVLHMAEKEGKLKAPSYKTPSVTLSFKVKAHDDPRFSIWGVITRIMNESLNIGIHPYYVEIKSRHIR